LPAVDPNLLAQALTVYFSRGNLSPAEQQMELPREREFSTSPIWFCRGLVERAARMPAAVVAADSWSVYVERGT
jgi:hypothetical protein